MPHIEIQLHNYSQEVKKRKLVVNKQAITKPAVKNLLIIDIICKKRNNQELNCFDCV
jgi:hypothetical protein